MRIKTLWSIGCEITEKLIHLCHDKGKRQRSLHYPFGNSARNAVFVLRSYDGVVNLAGMVLSIHLATVTSNTTPRFSRWGYFLAVWCCLYRPCTCRLPDWCWRKQRHALASVHVDSRRYPSASSSRLGGWCWAMPCRLPAWLQTSRVVPTVFRWQVIWVPFAINADHHFYDYKAEQWFLEYKDLLNTIFMWHLSHVPPIQT